MIAGVNTRVKPFCIFLYIFCIFLLTPQRKEGRMNKDVQRNRTKREKKAHHHPKTNPTSNARQHHGSHTFHPRQRNHTANNYYNIFRLHPQHHLCRNKPKMAKKGNLIEKTFILLITNLFNMNIAVGVLISLALLLITAILHPFGISFTSSFDYLLGTE